MTRRIWSAIGMTILLSACATIPETGRPGPDPDLPAMLTRLQAHREQGRTGSVSGFLYLREPAIPIPLKDWLVTLLPMTPRLERAVQRTREAYRDGGYAPLPFQTLDQLKQALAGYSTQLQNAGRGDLIRQTRTETGDDPKFEFREVPEGRWLLVAELPSPPSLAVWVVPVTVTAGTAAKQSLNDQTVIEGLTQ
ncbi:MAG: hypothetical protein HYY11_06220 [Candidatus Methylomirabilis oxyfera]|nr:hypothetical protein [Candidatus Methylomirabilis oxyfera]